MRDRDRDDFERRHGSGSGPEGYGTVVEVFAPARGGNLQGNFGFDRGGEGSGAGYFGGSDRGRTTTASYASGHGQTGGDLDRGFAGNAYRSGMGHDRFEDVRGCESWSASGCGTTITSTRARSM